MNTPNMNDSSYTERKEFMGNQYRVWYYMCRFQIKLRNMIVFEGAYRLIAYYIRPINLHVLKDV